MTVIKAAVLRSFGEPLVIEDLTLRSPEASEVRVEIDAVAICHSDITFFDGDWGGDLPAVYGHEAAGRVVEIGSDVSRCGGRRSRRGDPHQIVWAVPAMPPRASGRLPVKAGHGFPAH